MAPAIVNRYLHTLSKVLHLAVISGVIDSNPLARVGKLKEPPPRGVWLSGEEEDRLMPELEKDGAHMVAFAELPLHVGFRAGEPLSRRYGHVSFEDTSVLIVKTKTGRDRRVPLNSRALAILKDLRQGAGDDDLIFDPVRTGRHRRQMLYRFKAAAVRAKPPDFHYHDLRHTFATRLRAAGVHE